MQIKNNQKYLQKFCQVLVENKLEKQEKYFGRTKDMTSVIFSGENCKPGELVDIKITSFNKKNLFGTYKPSKIKAA